MRVIVEKTENRLKNSSKLLRKNWKILDTNDAEDDFRRILKETLKEIEIDNKVSAYKKTISNLASCLELSHSLEFQEEIFDYILYLPYFLLSKWEFLSNFINACKTGPQTWLTGERLEKQKLQRELEACAKHQHMTTRCSSFIVTLSTRSESEDLKFLANVLQNTLASPSSSTRSNASRSWLARLISSKKSENFINNHLLPLIFEELESAHYDIDFTKRPEMLQGITNIDPSWSDSFEKDPFPEKTLNFIAYFNILLASKSAGSQVAIKVEENYIASGISHYERSVRLLAYQVCQKFQIFPENLKNSIVWDLETDISEDIVEIIDDKMEQQLDRTSLNTARSRLKEENSQSSRFFPSEKRLDYGKCEGNDEENLEKLLRIQEIQEIYPSVSRVMNNLKGQGIDERAFVAEITKLLDSAAENLNLDNPQITSNFIFKLISRCPLRAVVDYGGEIVRKLSKLSEKFRETIFQNCVNLLSQDSENSRALTFEVCLIATILDDSSKFSIIWEICKRMASCKQKKMFEMLAKVVLNSAIIVSANDQKEMILCSLGLCPEVADFSCTQLFAATVSKAVESGHEMDRLPLFVTGTKNPNIFEIIQEILEKSNALFTKRSYHLTLHLFSKFICVDYEFYNMKQLGIIRKMKNFASFVLAKFCTDQIMVTAAVDAIIGILNWKIVEKMKDEKLDDPVDVLIRNHLRFCRHWIVPMPDNDVNNIKEISCDEVFISKPVKCREFFESHLSAFKMSQNEQLSEANLLNLLQKGDEELKMIVAWLGIRLEPRTLPRRETLLQIIQEKSNPLML